MVGNVRRDWLRADVFGKVAHVTPVLIGLLVAIGLALAVVGVVAYPHLRAGASLLTPEGERLAREARQRAQALAGSAAEVLTNRDRSSSGSGGPVDGYRGAPPPDGYRPGYGQPAGSGHGPGYAPASPPSSPSWGSGTDSGALPKLTGTRVVWASPPPQLRPDPAPAPPTGQRVGPGPAVTAPGPAVTAPGPAGTASGPVATPAPGSGTDPAPR
jgi:hypothetical protein